MSAEQQQSPPFNLTDLDRQTLSQTDEEFTPHDWNELRSIVATNRLDRFRRYPSSLRNYIAWSQDIKAKYGTMTDFVVQTRLRWDPTDIKNPTPFADPADYRILLNDWPYGLAPGICHLVVWLKPTLPVGADGRLTTESKALIEDFIQRVFVKKIVGMGVDVTLARDKVIWFKNGTALQSGTSQEHCHVLLRDIPATMFLS